MSLEFLKNIKGQTGDGIQAIINGDKVGFRKKPNNIVDESIAYDYTDSLVGVGLNTQWKGTELGTKREDETDYVYVDLKGAKGDPFTYADFTAEQLESLRGPAGRVISTLEFYNSFESLPATGEVGVLYAIPNSSTGKNVADNYYWDDTNKKYEAYGPLEADIESKANSADVYLKTETYSRSEVDSKVSNVDVSGKADKTDVTTLTARVSTLETEYTAVQSKLGDLQTYLNS